jgi:hypothetical protein
MDPLVLGAFLITLVVAVASLALLRRSRTEVADAPAGPSARVPDPPIVDAMSPAFITTHTGVRYNIGCLTGNGQMRYAVWTARSHELVRLFDSTQAGWSSAWEFFQRVERDRSAEWTDHRGARRSRSEWIRPGERPPWPLKTD